MKPILVFITAVFCFPLNSFSSNEIAKASGMSDLVLMSLMVGFILLLLAIIRALAKSIEGISRSPQLASKQINSNQATSKLIALLALLGGTFNLQAAEKNLSESSFVMTDDLFWILLTLIVFLAIIIGVLFRSLMILINLEKGEVLDEEKEESIFETLKLTDNIPLEEESNVMLDHEYDGIRELDNNLPPWWKYMFYATIIFAFVYIIRFHITGDGKLSHEEYMAEMNAAVAEKAEIMASAGEIISEENVVYLVDAPSIEKGAAIYKGNCATCHGQLGEGGAGPNLTDEYWLHGGGIKNVFKTIKYGVPEKGMIAWQSQFSPSQMQEVASYVLSLQMTNPPNGIPPQGEIYVAKIEDEKVAEDSIEIKMDTTIEAEELDQ